MFILEFILRAGGDPRPELTTRTHIPERNDSEKITRVLSSKETRSVGVYLPRRSRPLRRPRVAPTLLPVRATNPLRPRFTLSPYLIPLNPQLPPWLLTEHDSLRTALVINNSPALRSASPAAGHRASPHRLTVACVEPQLTPRFFFSLLVFVYFIPAARRVALFTSLPQPLRGSRGWQCPQNKPPPDSSGV